MKTLIVDDNDINRKLLQALLEAEGFETILANDGKEALQLLEHQKADCIISDIMMPNVDGFALLYKVKQDDRFKNTIFILYSAKAAFHDDEKFAIKMGADRYLQKTGSSRETIHTIHELFSKMNLREDNEKLEYRKKIINK